MSVIYVQNAEAQNIRSPCVAQTEFRSNSIELVFVDAMILIVDAIATLPGLCQLQSTASRDFRKHDARYPHRGCLGCEDCCDSSSWWPAEGLGRGA